MGQTGYFAVLGKRPEYGDPTTRKNLDEVLGENR
jgi:hypothetical protein